MKLLLTLAWRNLLRNRRRTLLTAIVIGVGLACLMFQDALIEGTLRTMIARATDTFEGHGKIYARSFEAAHEVERTLPGADQLKAHLSTAPELQAFAPRIETPAMLNSAKDSAAILLYGINPDDEQRVSKLSKSITSGKFLTASSTHEILLGSDLASQLQVQLGDRVVATVSQANSGELSQELFRVTGIYQLGEAYLDKGMALISLNDSQKLLGLGNDIHYYVLRFPSPQIATTLPSSFWDDLSSEAVIAANWRTLMPDIASLISLAETATEILVIILFCLVILIIMNTLFMSLFERLHEFGVLRALGTRPTQLATLILTEALLLGIASCLLGLLLGLLTIGLTAHTGIDYAGIDIAGVTFDSSIYPLFRSDQFTLFPLLLIGITVAAALYPAYTAATIIPTHAMRKQWR